MASKILVFFAIITIALQVQVYAKSPTPPKLLRTTSEDAYKVLDTVKIVLEQNVALGLIKLERLRDDYKKMGDAIMKETEGDRQHIYDSVMEYIQKAVDEAADLGVDVTECNVHTEQEFDDIMASASESARKHFEKYSSDCEIDINTGTEEMIGLGSDVEDLEQMLFQCADDDCYMKVYKIGKDLISLIPLREGNIEIGTGVDIIENHTDLRGLLYNITHSIISEMSTISGRVVNCINEKIDNTV